MYIWVPFLSALLGALIGSLASIISIILQGRFQSKRENRRLAIEAAIQDHKNAIDLATKTPGRRVIAPLGAFIYYHAKFIELIEADRLNSENLQALDKEMDRIHEVFESHPKNNQAHHPVITPPQSPPSKTEKPG